MKQVTLEEVKQNNGQEGKPAWVVVDGKVYDITGSRLWKNGKHVRSHDAGLDLSLEIQAAPHSADVLERFEQVGELASPPEKVDTDADWPGEPPLLFKLLLNNHPHPVSVHFPIALGLVSALFLLLSLITSYAPLEKAATFNLVVATLATPGAIFFGMLSWYYNYGHIWTSVYVRKTILSVVLMLLFIAALVLRFVFVTDGQQDAFFWAYVVCTLIIAPVVAGLGFLGGKITFPS